MKKQSQIFVGGYCGSGTRVIQLILKEAGYFIGDPICPVTLDYFPITSIKSNLVLGHGLGILDMKECIQKIFGCWWGKYNRWSIKYPFLMFSANYLKRIFPESKFILVVRNGMDNILNDHTMEGDIGSIIMPNILKEKDLLIRRMRFWNFAYKLAIHDQKFSPKDFYVIKLEDLVDSPVKEIEKMFKFLNITSDPIKCSKVVHKPKSIGKRHEEVVLPEGENYVIYDPKLDKDRVYEEGKEMLKYFNYEK